MTYSEAQKICGNQSKHGLRNMVKALSMHPWLNTKAEDERLAAAKIILRGWSAVEIMERRVSDV